MSAPHPLGNTTSIENPTREKTEKSPIESKADWRRKLYRGTTIAGDILPNFKVSACMCKMTGSRVGVEYTPGADGEGSAHYSGLIKCGSVWTCPICANKIAAERMDQIHKVIARSRTIPVLITYTIQHTRTGDKSRLKKTLGDLKKALRYLRQGSARKRFNSRFGVRGYVRSIEIRHGRNGWHPHSHELLLIDPGAGSVDTEEIKRQIESRYNRYLDRQGYTTNRFTVDVRTDVDAEQMVADYLTKSAVEVTAGQEKEGAGSLSPFQLLDAYDQTGDRKYADLYREYAAATKGRNWITWSQGLKKEYEIDDLTDEEIAEREEAAEQAETLIALSRDEWLMVLAKDMRAEIISVASQGDRGLLIAFLVDAGILPAGLRPGRYVADRSPP